VTSTRESIEPIVRMFEYTAGSEGAVVYEDFSRNFEMTLRHDFLASSRPSGQSLPANGGV
jgi:hypothetical protein